MKILLIEDDPPTRFALTEALTGNNYIVDVAVDGQEGLELAEAFPYDLILLDIVIPKLDGISLCRQLRTQGNTTPILLLTANDSSSDRVMGLDAGADDYVVKPFDMAELMARVRALGRRGGATSSEVIVWGKLRFDPLNSEVTYDNQRLHLTPKEYCLLELFLLNPKRVFSRRAILDRLWDFADSPGEETVSTHIKCLRQKLKAVGAIEIVETVHGLGYRLKGLPDTATAASQPTQQSVKQQRVSASTANLWQKFKDSFIEQVASLRQVMAQLANEPRSQELRTQAEQKAHKLAGSLGIFGLQMGSRLAREVELWLEGDRELTTADFQQVSTQLESLQEVVQQHSHSEPAVETPYLPLILIVDDDLLLAEHIRAEALVWGLRVEIATDLNTARRMIIQTPPSLILLDLNFPDSDEDGLVLLSELAQRTPRIPILAFTGRENLVDRVAVAQFGGCAFLPKSLSTSQILKRIVEVIEQPQAQRTDCILAVDDDSNALTYLAALLEPWQVQVTLLSNPKNFWEVLTEAQPALLILDCEMPMFSGIDLCQAVRNDPFWNKLQILFWSSHTESHAIDAAFAAGADDYLSKSASGSEIVTRIMHRLRRAGFQHQTDSA